MGAGYPQPRQLGVGEFFARILGFRALKDRGNHAQIVDPPAASLETPLRTWRCEGNRQAATGFESTIHVAVGLSDGCTLPLRGLRHRSGRVEERSMRLVTMSPR